MSVSSTALEILGAGLVVVNGKGLWASGNPAARRLLGLQGRVRGTALLDSLRSVTDLANLLDAGQGRREFTIARGAESFGRRIDARAFSLGFLKRTVLVLLDVTENAKLLAELSTLASKDALTGVNNRRQFDEIGERDIDLARRGSETIGVLMMDIDFFKKVNDEYGHEVGDRVLVKVAEACTGALRSTDIVGRYGGEEFAVVLPGSGPDESCLVSERLRAGIAAIALVLPDGLVSITVSLGVYAGIPLSGETLATYLRRADEALYRSKAMGRNRVSYWQPIRSEARG